MKSKKTKRVYKRKSKRPRKKTKSKLKVNKEIVSGKEEPKAAVIEYLKYYPLNSKLDVEKFYKRIDDEWGDFESGTNMIHVDVKSSKTVNSINDVLKVVDHVSKTTFCNRKNGNGDCEDTSDEVLKQIKEIPDGKYIVESHRVVYYEVPFDEEYEEYEEYGDPVFVQNHGFLVFYPISGPSKSWFRYGGKDGTIKFYE